MLINNTVDSMFPNICPLVCDIQPVFEALPTCENIQTTRIFAEESSFQHHYYDVLHFQLFYMPCIQGWEGVKGEIDLVVLNVFQQYPKIKKIQKNL